MNWLAELVAALAVGILKAMLDRRDLRDAVLARVERDLYALAQRAEEWKAAHPRAGDPRDEFVVRDRRTPKSLSADHSSKTEP